MVSAVWLVHEQVALAAMDCQATACAASCVNAVCHEFPNTSIRARRLKVCQYAQCHLKSVLLTTQLTENIKEWTWWICVPAPLQAILWIFAQYVRCFLFRRGCTLKRVQIWVKQRESMMLFWMKTPPTKWPWRERSAKESGVTHLVAQVCNLLGCVHKAMLRCIVLFS